MGLLPQLPEVMAPLPELPHSCPWNLCAIGARLLPAAAARTHMGCLAHVSRRPPSELRRTGPNCLQKGLELGKNCVFLGHIVPVATGHRQHRGVAPPPSSWLPSRASPRDLCFLCCVIKLSFAFKIPRPVIIQTIVARMLGPRSFELQGRRGEIPLSLQGG